MNEKDIKKIESVQSLYSEYKELASMKSFLVYELLVNKKTNVNDVIRDIEYKISLVEKEIKEKL